MTYTSCPSNFLAWVACPRKRVPELSDSEWEKDRKDVRTPAKAGWSRSATTGLNKRGAGRS
jgi:hypothetical protein